MTLELFGGGDWGHPTNILFTLQQVGELNEAARSSELWRNHMGKSYGVRSAVKALTRQRPGTHRGEDARSAKRGAAVRVLRAGRSAQVGGAPCGVCLNIFKSI